MEKRVIGLLVVAAVWAGSGGCGVNQAASDRQLTERQRDSIIATEKALPGSGVVGRALATSDSAAARAQRLDQQVEQGGDGSGDAK